MTAHPVQKTRSLAPVTAVTHLETTDLKASLCKLKAYPGFKECRGFARVATVRPGL